MKDSLVGDEWIREMCAANPVQHVINPETGQPNGNILTGPVRLAFCDHLFTPGRQMKNKPDSPMKYMTAVLFPPLADLGPLWQEYYRICASDFADTAYAQNGATYYNVDNPVRDQREKIQFGGYTPGAMFLNLSSNFQPAIVDTRGNPVTDPAKAYAGAWAIVAINAYASGKGTPRKGPRFGLVQVMLVGDDKPLAGGQPDPRQTFQGVNVKPPVAVPGSQFGQAPSVPPQGAPVNAGGYYGAPPPTNGFGAAPHPGPAPTTGYAPVAGGMPPGSTGSAYGAAPAPTRTPAPQLTAEERELRRIMGTSDLDDDIPF